jgi:hypothetical protein
MELQDMKPVRLEFIFTGGCGTNNARTIIDALNLKEYAHLGLMVINTDTPQLKFLFSPSEDDSSLRLWLDSGQLFILQLGESGNGVGGKPEIGEQTTRDQLQQSRTFSFLSTPSFWSAGVEAELVLAPCPL